MNIKMTSNKSRFFIFLLAVVVVLAPAFSLPRPVHAELIPCSVTSDADSGDGTLRALLADTTCDTIDFASDMSIGLTNQLEINRNVIIDGSGYAVTIYGNTIYAVRAFKVAENITVTIHHLTLTAMHSGLEGGGAIENRGTLTINNTAITGNEANHDGGAISNHGTLTINSSTISENEVVDQGGGIYNLGTLTVNDSVIQGNHSAYWGGGIYNLGILTIDHGTITTNTAMGGAGLYNRGGTLEVNSSNFTENIATGAAGGGITNSKGALPGGLVRDGLLTVTESTFTGNIAESGGAIFNDVGPLGSAAVLRSTFTGNRATGPYPYLVIRGGGAIYNTEDDLTVTGSIFNGNTAIGVGGAIASHPQKSPYLQPTVTNSTFNGNNSEVAGGAIWASGAALTNNTFFGNSAPDGATLWFYDDLAVPVTLYNNLMVKGGTGANCSIQYASPDQGGNPYGATGGNNLADDGSCVTASFSGVTSVPNLSSQIGLLGDNGGPTQTIPLLPGSDAIDAGDDTNCPATDQRGVTRPQGSACDIGAYEYEPPSEYTISGVVYEDLNANGVHDASEPGAEGAQVILDLGFNYLTASAAADGSYAFVLPPANTPDGFSVSVYVLPSSGVRITQTPALNMPLTGNLTGLDIGLHQVLLTLDPSTIPAGVVGSYYEQTWAIQGGDSPYSFTHPEQVDPGVPGLTFTFDEQAGTIKLSGTPEVANTYFLLVDFSDANGAFAQLAGHFTIHPPLQYSPESLPDGSLGAPYNQTILLSGGIAPYTFRIGGEQWLPAGLTVDTTSGDIVLSGTPAEAGQAALDVYVKDQTGTEIEIQPVFWVKTDPSLTLTSSLNPSLDGQVVIFSLGSTATVAHWPAPWGQVTFYADGAVISGCDGLWMGYNPTTEQPAPNPITCMTSSLAAGSHAITASLTPGYGPYHSMIATLSGGQTVNANVPQYQSTGFGAPLDLGGVLNIAKAGQMIPLKWQLLDGYGNPVLNLDPASVTMTVSSYACPSGVATDAIETYATGTSSLQNLGNGYYQMNWKTDKNWVNTCKKLTLKFGSWSGDGFLALFQFKK